MNKRKIRAKIKEAQNGDSMQEQIEKTHKTN